MLRMLYSGTPPCGHPWKVDTSIMWTLLNVPMINSTNVNFPLKRGHPYNQDMFLVPKSVHIIGVPLYWIIDRNHLLSLRFLYQGMLGTTWGPLSSWGYESGQENWRWHTRTNEWRLPTGPARPTGWQTYWWKGQEGVCVCVCMYVYTCIFECIFCCTSADQQCALFCSLSAKPFSRRRWRRWCWPKG